ncbi:MAG TPA: hypothetical protein VF331_21170 [Polyangiales bacterium]
MLGFLCVATPAFAAGKGKKSKDSADSAAPKTVDSLMDDSVKPDKKAKKGSAKSEEGGDEKTGDEKASDEKAQKKEEVVAEPDAWERPPAEEEKAPKAVSKKAEEKPVGDGRGVEIGLLLGWGFPTDKAFATSPYGLGFGLRAGYEFDFHLFTGLGFEYYLGSSDTLQRSGGGNAQGSVKSSSNYMFLHTEVGYDFWFDKVILRPSAWLGLGFGRQDPDPLVNGPKTHVGFLLAPGMSVLYTMDSVFIGGDFRVHLIAGGTGSSAVALYGTAGLRF